MRSLTADHPQLPLPPQPAHQLYQEWRAWTDQLYATNDANFRICLKLEEPVSGEGGERPWTLRYLLQARDDAALQIPAAYVWQERSSTLRFRNRRFDQPQERLLTGLGIASRLFAPSNAVCAPPSRSSPSFPPTRPTFFCGRSDPCSRAVALA